MKHVVPFLILFLLFPLYGFAQGDRGAEEQIFLQKKKTHTGHIEHYQMADMPDAVYYDSEAGEIIIVADGTSLYYNVEIVRDNLNLTVISTQVDGYGDTIDVSALPSGSYTIVITSQYLNEYEGTFYIQ